MVKLLALLASGLWLLAISGTPARAAPDVGSLGRGVLLGEDTRARPSSVSVPASKSDMLTDWRVEMLAQVNEYRKQSGKSVLAMDDRLNAMAKLHSDYQASVSKMTNGDPAGELRDRANYWGITGNILENVAHDSGDINSAMGTLKANDATNKHLLCDDCAIAGFGYSNGYWTQEFAQNGTVHTS